MPVEVVKVRNEFTLMCGRKDCDSEEIQVVMQECPVHVEKVKTLMLI